MTSLNRTLSGKAMVFDLAEEIEATRVGRASQQAGRTARTLLKDGSLRVTLILLDAGCDIAGHSAEGPITVHVLRGAIRLNVEGDEHTLRSGQLLSVGAGVRHAVVANENAAFLLTVMLPARAD